MLVSHETISELKVAQELNCGDQRMNAVSFILSHAKNSRAELIFIHDDLKGAERFRNLSTIRLYMTSIRTLDSAYETASETGLKSTQFNKDDFSELFYNDRRVMHVHLASVYVLRFDLSTLSTSN